MVKIIEIQSPEDILEQAQLGDMIEFLRGAYSHWAIYVGKLNLSLSRYKCTFLIHQFRRRKRDSPLG